MIRAFLMFEKLKQS